MMVSLQSKGISLSILLLLHTVPMVVYPYLVLLFGYGWSLSTKAKCWKPGPQSVHVKRWLAFKL